MRIQLEHTNIKVPSIAKSEKFLLAAFEDFKVRGTGFAEEFGYWSHVGNESTYIALLQRDKPGTETAVKVAPYSHNNHYRLMHVGIVVEDIEALIGRLRQAGFKPSLSDGLNSNPHRRNIYFSDDNGLEWEFVQYMTSDPALKNNYL